MVVFDFYPITGKNINSRDSWPVISFDPSPIYEPKRHIVESYRSQQKKASKNKK